jgi:L-fucose isomerase-like protein
MEYEFTDVSEEVFFIASGGSERQALDHSKLRNQIILLCHRESNSYAATMEIAAYLRSLDKKVLIVDVFSHNALDQFLNGLKASRAINMLKGEKAAVIGDVSEWLIHSDIDKDILESKLGIELTKIQWNQIGDFRTYSESSSFISNFDGVKQELLKDTSKVFSLLSDVIEKNELSAISVECFPMVREHEVTACLPLSVLNKEGVVAACEGDVCALIGKMILRSIYKEIPWQVNIAEIRDESILLAHCTAPLNMYSEYEITTHYETNCGTAIQGKIKENELAIFRINKDLSSYMLIEGKGVDCPNYDFACRTQLEFYCGPDQVQLLKSKALGNHHLVFPSKYAPVVRTMMELLAIQEVQ